MPHPEKVKIIEEIKSRIEGSTIAIATAYRGINVLEDTSLRAKLRAENVQYKVYKNTLAKLALEQLGLGEAAEFIDGPTSWAFCDDPVAPAKILKDFAKEAPAVVIQGGIFEGKPISKEQIHVLANLPSRIQLLAQVVGTIAMPLRNLVGVLNAVPRNLVNVLDQVRKQKEEAAA